MITKVYGTIDGVDVIFEYVGGNHWEVAVPFDSDGIYIVKLYAENERGDRSFYATALLIITAAGTCVTIKMFPYCVRVLPSNWEVSISNGYSAELIRCELCGRY